MYFVAHEPGFAFESRVGAAHQVWINAPPWNKDSCVDQLFLPTLWRGDPRVQRGAAR